MLIQRAKQEGITVVAGGRPSSVLRAEELARLGFAGIDKTLSDEVGGWKVNFMLYDTSETLRKRGTAMILG